jgi:hypothetical protein
MHIAQQYRLDSTRDAVSYATLRTAAKWRMINGDKTTALWLLAASVGGGAVNNTHCWTPPIQLSRMALSRYQKRPYERSLSTRPIRTSTNLDRLNFLALSLSSA